MFSPLENATSSSPFSVFLQMLEQMPLILITNYQLRVLFADTLLNLSEEAV